MDYICYQKNKSIFDTNISSVSGIIELLVIIVPVGKMITKIMNKKKRDQQPYVSIQLNDIPAFDNRIHPETNMEISNMENIAFKDVRGCI